jgi:hypothetical protein
VFLPAVPRDGGLKDVQTPVVVPDVALAEAEGDRVLPAVPGVYLVGAGAAVRDVFAEAARQQAQPASLPP